MLRRVSAAKREVMQRKWVSPREKEADRLLCDTSGYQVVAQNEPLKTNLQHF